MTTLIIATDEAGYGPTLGPLAVVATAWTLPSRIDLDIAAARLALPLPIAGLGTLRIDDSKKVFKQAHGAADKPAVHWLSEAASAWLQAPNPQSDFADWLRLAAADDADGLLATRWYSSPAADPICPDAATAIYQRLIDHWSAGGLQLVGQTARVIDAGPFNQDLVRYGNKSHLLGAVTCQVAVRLLQRLCDQSQPTIDQVLVFSDRLGGRAYYGGLLQHHLPDHTMQVQAESPQQSSYQFSGGPTPPLCWHFTVSGDGFPPVAMSSLIAKSTRERLMQRLNRFFCDAHHQNNPLSAPLRPTAGYAVDAKRFLLETAALRRQLKIADNDLIRQK